MEWAVLYHTEEHFDEIVSLLKYHGYSPEIFCDPECSQLYIPGMHINTIKTRPHFYIAVPRDQHFNAGKIIQEWVNKNQKEYVQMKLSTFSIALKSTFYTLLLLAAYVISRSYFSFEVKNITEVSTLIIIGTILWAGIFIYLITKKQPDPNNRRDFT